MRFTRPPSVGVVTLHGLIDKLSIGLLEKTSVRMSDLCWVLGSRSAMVFLGWRYGERYDRVRITLFESGLVSRNE